MKNITYEFSMRDIIRAVAESMEAVEDGIYQFVFESESITATIPRVFTQQQEKILPGHIVRFTGAKIIKANVDGQIAGPDDSSFEIRNGRILFYGDDRNDPRPIEISESLGEIG